MSDRPYRHKGDDLLHSGQYREWFWANLDDKVKAYLRAAPVMDATFKCVACRLTKPRTDFNLDTSQAEGYHRCNKCILTNPAKNEPSRWEAPDDDPNWFELSACSSAPTEIFFPENSFQANQPDAPWRAYCDSCPVVQQCKNFAAASDSRGVFGGEFIPYKGKQPVTTQAGRGRPRKAPA